jgi:hypothetical protein
MACQCNKHSKNTERVYEGTAIVDSNRVEEDFPEVTGTGHICSPMFVFISSISWLSLQLRGLSSPWLLDKNGADALDISAIIVRSKTRTNGGNPEPCLAKSDGSITSSGNGSASTLQEDIAQT